MMALSRDSNTSADLSKTDGPEAQVVAAKADIEIYRGFRRGRELEQKLLAAAEGSKVSEDSQSAVRFLPGLEPVVQQGLGFLINAFVLQSGMFFPPTVSRAFATPCAL